MQKARDVLVRTKNKVISLPKRTKMMIGGGLIAVVVIFGGALAVQTNTANTRAKAFDEQLKSYVAKLDATNNSISALRPHVGSAPTLESATMAWFSSEYKKASAKQAILDVHQQEVLAKVPEYKTGNHLGELGEYRSTFNRLYNSNLPESLDETTRSIVDVKFDRNTAVRNSESRIDPLYKNLKNRIQDLEVSSYDEPTKRYTLSQIDAAVELDNKYQTAVKEADTFAEIRTLNKRHMMEMRFPTYDPNYGIAAMFAAQQAPFRFTAPAVTSLKSSLESYTDDDREEAKIAAYASLYGTMAAYNTPAAEDETAVSLQKIGMATYALNRLETILKDQPDSDETKEVSAKLATAQRSFGSLPYGNEATKIPSAATRISSLYEIVTETSGYDGYSDLIAALRAAQFSDKSVPGATIDFEAYNSLRSFADSAYPATLLPKETVAYKKAVDRCIEVRLAYHKAGEKVLNKQIDLARNVVRLGKEVRQLERSGRDAGRLSSIQADVQKSNSELTKLQQSLKPAEDTQTKDLEGCTPGLKTALDNIQAKSNDLPGLYKTAREQSQALTKTD